MSIDWQFCGQEKITDFLAKAVETGQLASAYVFVGSSGLGKRALAEKLVSAVLCRGEADAVKTAGQNQIAGQKPCGVCHDCLQLNRQMHPDVYLVKRLADKKDISVEQIRELKSRLEQGTFFNGYKAAIIDEAENMNLNAANAFLKILEEPTPKTIMILLADRLDSLPKTIVSRCQVFKFLPVSEEKISAFLRGRGNAQGAAVDYRAISRLAFGRPGWALDFLRHPEMLADYEENISLFFKILAAPAWQKLALVQNLFGAAESEPDKIAKIKNLFFAWRVAARDFLLLANQNEPLVANAGSYQWLQKNRQNFSWQRAREATKLFQQAEDYLAQNVGSKNVLENLIINL